jgi:hypothetical protein
MSDLKQDPERELSAEARELLARARRQRNEEHAPSGLRQRALSRAVAELTRPEPTIAALPAPLVAIKRPSLRLGTALLAACALGGGLLVSGRLLLQSGGEGALGPEPRTSADWHASGPAGELLAPHSPLLRKPLLPLESEPAPNGKSLLGELPFSEPAAAWQVRRWNDPKADPELPAARDFEGGALCLTLGAGERVIGGWPWPREGDEPPAKVALRTGGSYRLAFKARVSGALPAQVLIGVGHTAWPFVAAAGARVQVSRSEQPFAMDFVAQRDDDSVGIAFLAAATHGDGTRLCLRDVVLSER